MKSIILEALQRTMTRKRFEALVIFAVLRADAVIIAVVCFGLALAYVIL